MWPFSKAAAQPKTLEEQLNFFASCGVTLREGITVDDLLFSNSRAAYEGDPLLLAIHLGSEVEKEPFARISDRLWHLDTECIEDEGSYVRIAERMRDLASPHLPLENISDHVDLENAEAELSFSIAGEQIDWQLAVDNDWVDAAIFGKFVGLLRKRTSSSSYTYMDLGGQDCLIGFATEDQRKRLNTVPPLKFVPLS